MVAQGVQQGHYVAVYNGSFQEEKAICIVTDHSQQGIILDNDMGP